MRQQTLAHKQSKFNALGQLVQTIDGYGTLNATATYEYEDRGLLDKVYVDGALVSDLDYDLAGKRTKIIDAASGTTITDYDVLGQPFTSTDAKGQVTRYTFDKLGRLRERTDDYGGAAVLNEWDYDAAGHLVGRSNPFMDEALQYDTVGRLENRTIDLSIPGYPGNGLRSISYGYDSSGRLSSETFPDAITFTQTYTANGYRDQVQIAGTYLEDIVAVNAFGQPTEFQYANRMSTVRDYYDNTGLMASIETGTFAAPASVLDLHYVWNQDGTLHSRADERGTAPGTVDTFSYDQMLRLTSAVTSGATARTKTFEYDLRGNLEDKRSDVAGDLDAIWQDYGGHPYRLSGAQVDGHWNALHYDANGNIYRYNRTGEDDRFIDYDAANRPTRITVGSYANTPTPAARDEYWYGPDGERLVRKSTWDDAGTEKTTWVEYLDGGRYERVYPVHDSSVQYVAKVMPTEGVLYQLVKDASGGTSTFANFVHRDHLGSITSVTDSAGEVRSLSYDPFGARRSSDWSSDAPASELATAQGDFEAYTHHGFTDHEHLDRTGLIHMGGRLYDPELGRFLQPDPFVQNPAHSQSFNRYAYVANQPLNAVDRSGLCGAAIIDFTSPSQGELGGGGGPQLTPPCIQSLVNLGIWNGGAGRGGAGIGSSPIFPVGGFGGGNPPQANPAPSLNDAGSPPPYSSGLPAYAMGPGDFRIADTIGTAANAVGTAAIYFNRYVLGVELRDPSDLIAAVPMAAINFFPVGRAARGSADAVMLGKQLASMEGVAELLSTGGKAIAGPGTPVPLRDVSRLVSEYGGAAADWVKVTSTAPGHLQTHAYRNLQTGEVVELKSIIP